jgi:hypothetical protein
VRAVHAWHSALGICAVKGWGGERAWRPNGSQTGGPSRLDGYWGGLPGTAASEIAQAPRCTQQPCMHGRWHYRRIAASPQRSVPAARCWPLSRAHSSPSPPWPHGWACSLTKPARQAASTSTSTSTSKRVCSVQAWQQASAAMQAWCVQGSSASVGPLRPCQIDNRACPVGFPVGGQKRRLGRLSRSDTSRPSTPPPSLRNTSPLLWSPSSHSPQSRRRAASVRSFP